MSSGTQHPTMNEISGELQERSTFVDDWGENDSDWNTTSITQTNTGIPGSVWKNSLDKVDYYKVVNFCVADILKSTKHNDHFVTRNSHFLHVRIFGTIISKTFNGKRLYVVVQDGSESITCFLDEDYFTNDRDENIELFRQKEHKTDNLFQATSMILSSSQHFSSRYLPKNSDSIKRGDMVLLEGKLSEYKKQLNVFVTKLNKITVIELIENLTHRVSFYDNHLSTED